MQGSGPPTPTSGAIANTGNAGTIINPSRRYHALGFGSNYFRPMGDSTPAPLVPLPAVAEAPAGAWTASLSAGSAPAAAKAEAGAIAAVEAKAEVAGGGGSPPRSYCDERTSGTMGGIAGSSSRSLLGSGGDAASASTAAAARVEGQAMGGAIASRGYYDWGHVRFLDLGQDLSLKPAEAGADDDDDDGDLADEAPEDSGKESKSASAAVTADDDDDVPGKEGGTRKEESDDGRATTRGGYEKSRSFGGPLVPLPAVAEAAGAWTGLPTSLAASAAEGIAALERIGFQWNGRFCSTGIRKQKRSLWERRLCELKQFKYIHGHCNVRRSDNKQLVEWVKRQRREYRLLGKGKQSSMTAGRIVALERIGFEWIRNETIWERRLGELKQFISIHGHCNVPQGRSENKQLAIWVRSQRQQYQLRRNGTKSAMTDDCMHALDSIGFQWDLFVRGLEERQRENGTCTTGDGGLAAPKKWICNRCHRQENGFDTFVEACAHEALCMTK